MAGEDKNPIFGDGEGVVFLNKFYGTNAEEQEHLLAELIRITEEVIRYQPGFISANIHKGFDDFAVTNIARWRSPADLKRALQQPAMLAHRDVLGTHFKREGSLGRIAYTYVARPEGEAEA